MKKQWFLLPVLALLLACCNNCPETKPTIPGDFLNGTWTYRSLLDSQDVNADFDSLEFAAATVQLKTSGKDSVTGIIYWQQNPLQGLKLTGKYFYNDTTTCFFLEGFGDSAMGTPGWQYNYQGYAVPKWAQGVNQAQTLVGSVVRVKKHSCNAQGDSCHPAGVVATIYLVKQTP